MKKLIVVFLGLAIVFGGGGFYGGTAYQKSQMPDREQFRTMMGRGAMGGQGGPGGPGGFSGQGQGRPFSGEIIEKDDTSITIKLQDGSTKIIMLSKSTAINKSTAGSREDLKQGERIMAIGTENSDGSVTANMVQLGDRFIRQ